MPGATGLFFTIFPVFRTLRVIFVFATVFNDEFVGRGYTIGDRAHYVWGSLGGIPAWLDLQIGRVSGRTSLRKIRYIDELGT